MDFFSELIQKSRFTWMIQNHWSSGIHSHEGAVFSPIYLFTVVLRLLRADCKHTAMAAERGGGDNNLNDEMGNQLQLLPGT